MAARSSLWAAATKSDPASALKIFLQLHIRSQPSGSSVKLIICTASEELRVCVSTSIREAMMGHAWNVMVSASPLRIKQTKFSAKLTFVFVREFANKLWQLLSEDKRVTVGGDIAVSRVIKMLIFDTLVFLDWVETPMWFTLSTRLSWRS